MAAPGQAVDGIPRAGAIHVFDSVVTELGTELVIAGNEVLTQRSPLRADDAEPGDRFGAGL